VETTPTPSLEGTNGMMMMKDTQSYRTATSLAVCMEDDLVAPHTQSSHSSCLWNRKVPMNFVFIFLFLITLESPNIVFGHLGFS
jgi:hypothetical protein